ncbi:MAG: DUF1295 domain-containing protein [Phycisphaeraceae bacterium]|nr:DUF1295 domain-containing protein [Phycisphaeraceae bacterium]
MPTLTPLEQVVWLLVASVLLFGLLWLAQRKTGDAGIVDVGWSYAVAVGAVFAAATGEGSTHHRLLIATMIGLWGFRLGTHILTDRVLTGHEDGRYQMARERFGDRFQPFMFIFYQFQAISVPLLCLAPIAAATTSRNGLGPIALAGLGLYLIAVAGESLADMQLKRFKKDAANKGKTCRAGLWRYSRHPNYFFEWLLWVSYALVAAESPHWWLALVPVATMYLLLTRITGIPPTEAQSVRSRGDDYRAYQKETSAFFPWFPRPSALSHTSVPQQPYSEDQA